MWPTWVSFSASVLLFVGAMITLCVTNRTNRAAIAAANMRERDKWRNDAVLKAVAAELEISNDVVRELLGYMTWKPDDDLRSLDRRLRARIDDMAPHVAAFRILVGDGFADLAEAHRKALHEHCSMR